MAIQAKISHGVLVGLGPTFLLVSAFLPASAAHSESKVSYSRDVLPILSDKCFKCHGPDGGSRQADLRLDTSQGAFANRNGHWPIVPGKPQNSLVVKKIHDQDDPMPPKSSGKSLSANETAILTKWIEQGAHYDRLWSLDPLPTQIPIPAVTSTWPKNDIDRFTLAQMRKVGLSPNRPASRERLLRRVTLDLTGLPPTEADVSAFSNDRKVDAYERVVDRLLASPHFGERLAVDWLDAARYSDSYGYQSDLLMPTWPYRDWVVKAFNQNLPYNQFLTDQIAGDLLPHPTRDTVLATAFNRLHRQSNEGGSIADEYKTEYAVDRVSTFGTAVLGLTLGCARCHDHKFDPVSQREFYQLFGYFNSIKEYGLLLSTEVVPTPSLLLPSPTQAAKLTTLRANSQNASKQLTDAKLATDKPFNTWLSQNSAEPKIPGLLLHLDFERAKDGKFVNGQNSTLPGEQIGGLKVVDTEHGKAAQFQGDDGLLTKGLPAKDRWQPFTWAFWMKDVVQNLGPVVLLHRTGGTDVGFCGFDLMLEDGFLTARVMRQWPGNAIAIRTKNRVPKATWTHLGWSWDGSGSASGLKLHLNGHLAESTVLNDQIWKKINAYGDLGPSGGEWSFAQRFRDAGFKGGLVSQLYFADRALSPIEIRQLQDGHSLTNALKQPSNNRDEIKEYYNAAIDPEVKVARDRMMKAQADLAAFEENINEISVMQEAIPRVPAYLLARGRYDAPKTNATMVQRGVPRALPPLPQTDHNDRYALAQWATRPNHPLTSRVAVNRLWQMVFGVGLVETSENFGVQGSRPTNQALLDYLARHFINSGWNVKAMLRQMVTSATYCQDSLRSPHKVKVDPENRYLARGPSQRLPAEMVRDTVLAASGLMNPRIGGSPVNPYQPAGIWQENNTMSPQFIQSTGPDLYRRSLYSTWKRTTPVPSMMLFDATSREACAVRRPATNTPLQALVLLNDVQFVEAARKLAERALLGSPDDASRLNYIFLRLAGRHPTSRESSIVLATLNDQRRDYLKDPKAANLLIKIGDSKPARTLAPSELAAMTVAVQTVLNSDAVVWKR